MPEARTDGSARRAAIAVAADGSATLYCGTVYMGQGSTTALAQIAAEALRIEAEAVRVVAPDTIPM
jgi:CO/xanthine dehydrogenase Mo-binding subunit